MVHCPASASRTKLEARGGGEGVEDLLGAVVDHGPGVEVVVGQGDVGDLDVVAGVDVDAVGVVARNGAPRRGQEDDQVAHAHRTGRVEAAQDVPHRVARGVEQARGQPGQVLQGDRLPPWGELDIDCVTHCSSHPLRERVAGPAGPGRRQGACGPRAPGPAPAVSPVRPPAWRRGGRASAGSVLSVACQWLLSGSSVADGGRHGVGEGPAVGEPVRQARRRRAARSAARRAVGGRGARPAALQGLRSGREKRMLLHQPANTAGIASSRYQVQNARRAGTSVSSIGCQLRASAAALAQQQLVSSDSGRSSLSSVSSPAVP